MLQTRRNPTKPGPVGLIVAGTCLPTPHHHDHQTSRHRAWRQPAHHHRPLDAGCCTCAVFRARLHGRDPLCRIAAGAAGSSRRPRSQPRDRRGPDHTGRRDHGRGWPGRRTGWLAALRHHPLRNRLDHEGDHWRSLRRSDRARRGAGRRDTRVGNAVAAAASGRRGHHPARPRDASLWFAQLSHRPRARRRGRPLGRRRLFRHRAQPCAASRAALRARHAPRVLERRRGTARTGARAPIGHEELRCTCSRPGGGSPRDERLHHQPLRERYASVRAGARRQRPRPALASGLSRWKT
jgi:hypothetical protein